MSDHSSSSHYNIYYTFLVFFDNPSRFGCEQQYFTRCKDRNKELTVVQDRLIERKAEEKVYEILRPIFTSGQIKKLLHPNQKKVKWSAEDIASAISLRSVSPKAYRFLRNKKFPLPALSTLRKWASKLDINVGVVDSIISLKNYNK